MNRQDFVKDMVSIVIPTYNNSDLVVDMIKSIQSNSYNNWELLLVDDISYDSEFKKIEEYTNNDQRITLVQRDRAPKGAQTCRNIGLSMAKGEYICFFDSDDLISIDCLKDRFEYICNKKELDFAVFPSGLMIGDQIIEYPKRLSFGYSIGNNDLARFLSRDLPFIVCSNLYRTCSLRKNNISWDENILSMQDGDFNIQCLLKKLKYGYAETNPNYFYRINTNTQSISKKITSKEHFLSHLYYIEKCYQTVQGTYGSFYNKELFDGVIYIFNIIFCDKIDSNMAYQLAHLVEKYDVERGLYLCQKTSLILQFSKYMSIHNARRIALWKHIIKFIYNKQRRKIITIHLQKKIRSNEKAISNHSNI